MKTDKAIETLATNFCKLSAGMQHKELYVKSLESLVRLAKMENEIDPDCDIDKITEIMKVSE